ncbi:MAG: 2-oxo-4-hydroxy-4-carboxy-5-ureidoimidazoline decarboxylase [Woeseiaceae bacterium]|nr:2-oxo-4-hydroxy-4-carboxy-5-ureidoimidazoline decarboxylase [Woeseiaceae bacterium]
MPQTREEFVARYGGVYEHSPWVAEQAYDSARDVEDATQLAKLMADRVDQAPAERRLALIRAHPDLAGKAAIAGELTDESSEEQAAAGIDRCSPREYAEFQSLNERYKRKFGFPFVMAVRNSNRHEILEVFARRLENDEETEFATAIAEIHKIARMRLKAMNHS